MAENISLDENDSVKKIRHAGLFQRRQELRLHENAVGLSYRKYFMHREVQISKEDITGLCYSFRVIQGHYFNWGVQFNIIITGRSGKQLRIDFKSFLNRQRNELLQQYQDLLELIWDRYFEPLVRNYLLEIEKGNEVEIGPVRINKNSITFKKTGLVGSCEKKIPMERLALSEYRSYCTVYDNGDAAKTNASYTYASDPWAVVIYSVVKAIVKTETVEDGS